MLKIKNLCAEVENKQILKGINLTVPANNVSVIMGPNGTGKSTICKIIMGDNDYKITKGTIEFNNENITDMSTSEIAQRGIFLVMQNPTEIPGVTNAEMLRTALTARGIKESIFEFNKRLNETCEILHIDKSFIHRNINERMSGGEKKKNELLQLYMLKPSLIILDELDSGLDVDSLNSLSTALMEYKKENKCSIIIITHHTNILKYIEPDAVYVLNNGEIVETGDMSLANSIEKYGFSGAFNMSESDEHE